MKTAKLKLLIPATVVGVILLSSCGAGLNIKNLGKGAIDFVADAHYRQTQDLLRELTVKLYLRNPVELRKTPDMSIERRGEQLFAASGRVLFAELDFVEGIQALDLALDPNYSGDRVFALMAGLNGMIRNAYEYRSESYMFDQLDERKLYISARNIEILTWRLKQQGGEAPGPLLLTNSQPGEIENLSFERLFGKLIAVQDMMAVIVSQRNDRLIINVTQNMATMVFFPL